MTFVAGASELAIPVIPQQERLRGSVKVQVLVVVRQLCVLGLFDLALELLLHGLVDLHSAPANANEFGERTDIEDVALQPGLPASSKRQLPLESGERDPAGELVSHIAQRRRAQRLSDTDAVRPRCEQVSSIR